MRIVNQSFEPLNQTGNHITNIASAARICYKSEDKALKDETPFVKGLVKGKHNSTLEMSVLHLLIHNIDSMEYGYLADSNYLFVNKSQNFENQAYEVTGSVRAWREFIIAYQNTICSHLVSAIATYLRQALPTILTTDFDTTIFDPTDKYDIREFDPKDTFYSISKYHIHQGIKFITNRAVTHELVRHRPCSFLQESQRYCAYNKGQFGHEVTFIKPTAFFSEENTKELYDLWSISCNYAEQDYLAMLRNGASPQAARTVLPNSCKTEIIVFCSLAQWEHIFKLRHSSKCDPSMQEAIAPVFDWFTKEYPEHFTTKENLHRSIG